MFPVISRLAQAVLSIHPNEAEVSLENAHCNIDSAHLKALKKKAATLLWYASEKGFGQFPIDRKRPIRSVIGRFLTRISHRWRSGAEKGLKKQRDKMKSGDVLKNRVFLKKS